MSERIRVNQDDQLSPLQRLKNLSQEEQECLTAQRRGKGAISVKRLIAQIEARHGIYGLSPQRWSEFVEWFEEQEAGREANASIENLRSMSSGVMSLEDLHAWCRDLLRITGMRNRDIKTLKFVTQEVRKIMAMQDAREKFAAAQRTKVEAGLAAVFEDIKHDPCAVELFEKITARISEASKE